MLFEGFSYSETGEIVAIVEVRFCSKTAALLLILMLHGASCEASVGKHMPIRKRCH